MKKILFLMITCFAFLIVGCGNQAPQNAKVEKLSVGLMPDIDAIPFIIAEKNGYFKEEGVEVELHNFKSAMDRDAALQSGNLDGAISDMLAVAFAKKGGFNLKITSSTNGNYRLVASGGNKATTIESMKGQQIAVSKNTIIEFVLDQILNAAGMQDNSVEKVVIPQIPTRLAMLEDNKLDGAVLPDPLGPIAITKGSHEISSSAKLNIQPGVIAFRAETIKNNPEAIKKMYRAYNKAIEYMNKTPQEEYIDYAIEKAGLPPATKTAEKLPKYKLATLPEKSDWERVINWLNKKDLVSEKYSYDSVVSEIAK